jgi:O-methyltransferase
MYIELLKKCLTASCYDESSWDIVDPVDSVKRSIFRPMQYTRGIARRLMMEYFSKKNFGLIIRNPFDQAARDEGKDWPCFGYSMAGHKRLDNIQYCVEDVMANNVPGDFIETGVWRGGMVMMMAALLKLAGDTERKVWVADSFEGLPVPLSGTDGDDLSHVNHLKVSLEQVKANFARFDLLSDQVQFLKGWFCDTLPHAPIERLAILRLDGDLYSSTMDALKNLYHKVSPGGYVIVDDYNGWDSCRAAIADFLKEHDLNPEIKLIDWTGAYWKVEAQLVPAGSANASHVGAR